MLVLSPQYDITSLSTTKNCTKIFGDTLLFSLHDANTRYRHFALRHARALMIGTNSLVSQIHNISAVLCPTVSSTPRTITSAHVKTRRAATGAIGCVCRLSGGVLLPYQRRPPPQEFARVEEISRELVRLESSAKALRRERDLLLQQGRTVPETTPGERYLIAKQLKASGATFAEIGRELGCSRQRAKQIIAHGDQKKFPPAQQQPGTVSARTTNAIIKLLCLSSNTITKQHLMRAAIRIEELKRMPNFGEKSTNELLRAAAIASGSGTTEDKLNKQKP
ncbi:hypothetical protein [Devosia sp. 2618]|uniref:hypothetical protein n=1 Tax=Devosia sp. 2618 TaxID=3156454 RepID=UPI00339692B7